MNNASRRPAQLHQTQELFEKDDSETYSTRDIAEPRKAVDRFPKQQNALMPFVCFRSARR